MSTLLVAAGEPEYEAKPVSHWLAILKNPSATATNRESIRVAFRQARTALLSIGPAALPHLAEDLDDKKDFVRFLTRWGTAGQDLGGRIGGKGKDKDDDGPPKDDDDPVPLLSADPKPFTGQR